MRFKNGLTKNREDKCNKLSEIAGEIEESMKQRGPLMVDLHHCSCITAVASLHLHIDLPTIDHPRFYYSFTI